MKRLIIIALLTIALSACGSLAQHTGSIVPSKGDAVLVKVPVPIAPPAPPVVARPALAIEQLRKGDEKNPAKVVKAYKATVKSLEGYSEQLEIILDGYRKASIQPIIPTVEEVARPAAASSVFATGGN